MVSAMATAHCRPKPLALPLFIAGILVLAGTSQQYWRRRSALPHWSSAVRHAVAHQRVMTGPVAEGNERIGDLVGREMIVVATVDRAVTVLGVHPNLCSTSSIRRSRTP